VLSWHGSCANEQGADKDRTKKGRKKASKMHAQGATKGDQITASKRKSKAKQVEGGQPSEKKRRLPPENHELHVSKHLRPAEGTRAKC